MKRHYKLKIKQDVSLLELAEIVEKSFTGGATAAFLDGLEDKTKRHCERMTEKEIESLPEFMREKMPSE